jgi:integrase
VVALLQASQGTVWEVPILLAAVTGARRSEILGIAWEEIDLREGTIFICRGAQSIRRAEEGKGIAFTPVKTKRARRFLQLPPSLSSGSGGTGENSSNDEPAWDPGGTTRSTSSAGPSP